MRIVGVKCRMPIKKYQHLPNAPTDSFLINLPSEVNVWRDYRSGWVLSFGTSLMDTLIGLERWHYGTADFAFAAD